MGSDGHTASIFPHEIHLLNATENCVVATHPESGQIRVSLSGPVINTASQVAFLITGASKKSVLQEIVEGGSAAKPYPTSFIRPAQLDWFLDEAAAP